MARPTRPYGRRSVASYERDREYLLRLRNAVWLDGDLDADRVADVCKKIDDLILSLRDLGGSQKRAVGE